MGEAFLEEAYFPIVSIIGMFPAITNKLTESERRSIEQIP